MNEDSCVVELSGGEVTSGRPGVADGGEGGQSPTLVGRSRLIGRLGDLRSAAHAAGNHVAFVGGDPGVGKTTLVRAFADQTAAAGGAVVLQGACSPIRTFLSYEPFVRALDRYAAAAPIDELRHRLAGGASALKLLAPSIGERLPDVVDLVVDDPLSGRVAIERALVGFFVRLGAEEGLVLVLDDLHWADESTADILRLLIDQAGGGDVFVVATYRTNELPRHVARTVDLMVGRGSAHVMSVAGLDAASSDRVADAVAGAPLPAAVRARVRATSEGNPLFVREIVRHLLESGALLRRPDGSWRVADLAAVTIPKSVEGMIGERLSRLSKETRTALVRAAVLGRDFSYEMWERIGAVAPDALGRAAEEAVEAGLIDQVADTDLYSFSHALIAAELTRDLPAVKLKRLHRQVAQDLEALYVIDGPGEAADHAPELAYHFVRGGSTVAEAASLYSQLAVRHATGNGDLDLAERCAADWWERSGTPDAALLLARLLLSEASRSACLRAEGVLARAQRDCPPGNPQLVELLALRSEGFASLGDLDAARALIAAATAEAGPGSTQLTASLAATHFVAGRPADALRVFTENGVSGGVAEVIELSSMLVVGDLDGLASRVRAEPGVPLGERSLFALALAAMVAFYRGDFDAAERDARAAHHDASSPADTLVRQNATLALGYLGLERGRCREAMGWLREVIDSLAGLNPDHCSVGVLARVAASCGDIDGARAAVESLERIGLDLHGPFAAGTARGVAHYRLVTGSTAAEAAQILRVTAANMRFQQQVLAEAELLNELVGLQQATEDECARLGEIATRVGSPWIAEWAEHGRAWSARDADALGEMSRRFQRRGACRDALAAARTAALLADGGPPAAAARAAAHLARVAAATDFAAHLA